MNLPALLIEELDGYCGPDEILESLVTAYWQCLRDDAVDRMDAYLSEHVRAAMDAGFLPVEDVAPGAGRRLQ